MLSEFHGIVPELMPKFGVGRLVFFLVGGGSLGGGGWRFGAGVGGGGGAVAWWGWPCVSCVVFDVLLCVLTKCFFRVCFCFASLLSAVVSCQVSSSRFFAR